MLKYNFKKSVLGLVKLIIAAAMVWALYFYGYLDFSALLTAVEHPWLLLLTIFLCVAIVLVNGYRWFVIIRVQNVHLSVYKVIRGYIYASLSGFFLPGILGVDAIRSLQSLRWAPQNRAGVLSALLMDRVVGVYSVILVTTVLCILFWQKLSENPILLLVSYFALAALLGLTVFLIFGIEIGERLAKKLRKFEVFNKFSPLRFIARFLETLPLYRLHWRSIIFCFFLSLVATSTFLCVLYLLAVAQGFEIKVGHTMLAGAIAAFANAFPITPGGLGLGEGVFSEVCKLLSTSIEPMPYGNILLSWRILVVVSIIAFFPIIMLKKV